MTAELNDEEFPKTNKTFDKLREEILWEMNVAGHKSETRSGPNRKQVAGHKQETRSNNRRQ